MPETKTSTYFKGPVFYSGTGKTYFLCKARETTYGQARWTTQGKGFGRKSGWLISGITFLTMNAPHPGGVKVTGKKMLDTKTGKIYSRKEHCKKVPESRVPWHMK